MSLDRVYVKLHEGGIGYLTELNSRFYRIERIESRGIMSVRKSAFHSYAQVLPEDDQVKLNEESLNNWLDR